MRTGFHRRRVFHPQQESPHILRLDHRHSAYTLPSSRPQWIPGHTPIPDRYRFRCMHSRLHTQSFLECAHTSLVRIATPTGTFRPVTDNRVADTSSIYALVLLCTRVSVVAVPIGSNKLTIRTDFTSIVWIGSPEIQAPLASTQSGAGHSSLPIQSPRALQSEFSPPPLHRKQCLRPCCPLPGHPHPPLDTREILLLPRVR